MLPCTRPSTITFCTSLVFPTQYVSHKLWGVDNNSMNMYNYALNWIKNNIVGLPVCRPLSAHTCVLKIL